MEDKRWKVEDYVESSLWIALCGIHHTLHIIHDASYITHHISDLRSYMQICTYHCSSNRGDVRIA